jgi:hypothetical protein
MIGCEVGMARIQASHPLRDRLQGHSAVTANDTPLSEDTLASFAPSCVVITRNSVPVPFDNCST